MNITSKENMCKVSVIGREVVIVIFAFLFQVLSPSFSWPQPEFQLLWFFYLVE